MSRDIDWTAWRARVLGELIGLGCPDEEAVAEARLAEARMKVRLAWLDALFGRMRALDDALAEFWGGFYDAHPEIDDEDPDPADLPPDPPEQAELEAIERAIEDLRERGLWPRHLYFAKV